MLLCDRCLSDSSFTEHEEGERAPDQQICDKPVTDDAASRGARCGGMGARVGARVLAGASGEWPLQVDLSAVTFVDGRGLAALRRLGANALEIINCPEFIGELLRTP